MTGLCCLFQVGLELLLFFMPPLHFSLLLFEHLSIVLENVRGDGRRHSNTEEKAKTFLFCLYCWSRHHHGILQINSIRLQRLSSKGEILSYAKSIHPGNIFPQWYCLLNVYYTSLPSMAAIFLAICSYSSNVTIWVFCLLWWKYSYLTWSSIAESYSCQCLNTETSAQGNRDYTTETLSISYTISLYIRLVVVL